MSQSFKAIYCNSEGDIKCEGLYTGATPKMAACKAFNSILKSFKGKEIYESRIGMYEITCDSNNKIYWFICKKEKLDKEINLYKYENKYLSFEKIKELGLENKIEPVITYSFNITATRIPSNECKDLLPNNSINNICK
jgi:hypothetical protein